MHNIPIRFDAHKHGIGTRVYDLHTDRYGIVVDIRETTYEWLDMFVDFGSGSEKVNYWDILVVKNDKTNADA